jgi:hypothetical protein
LVAFPDTEHLPGRIRVRNATTDVLCHSEQSRSTRSCVPSPPTYYLIQYTGQPTCYMVNRYTNIKESGGAPGLPVPSSRPLPERVTSSNARR